MRVASNKTLNISRKTRLSYADRAIERESMCGEKDREQKADEASMRMVRGEMDREEMLEWATREQEWRLLK